jgi:acyl carrier protein phosphodiesterase
MNFLAHIFLSGKSEQILVGNFIGDSIKGKHYDNYPVLVQRGITLHRFIDFYTDTHPVVQRSKFLLNSRYHKYSGVITDIFYDHFLAISWDKFSDIPLREFIYHSYDVLIRNSIGFPREVKRFFPFFILHNWLEVYTSVNGIERVLKGMSRNTSLPDHTRFAIETLVGNYSRFEDHFLEFFPQIIDEVEKKFNISVYTKHSSDLYMPRA